MRRLRRPSPALVIASLALFVALGGGAYAALSKNSVGSKQIKNGSVTGKDIKDNNVKGKDVRESTLSEVPSAAAATKATSADDASALAGMHATRLAPFTLTNNQTRDLITVGPLKLTARCEINNGGTDFAHIELSTSVDNAAFDGDNDDADFDVADSPLDIAESQNTTGTPSFDNESDGVAIAPGGAELQTHMLYTGTNVLNQPGTCTFGGVILSSAG